MKIDNNVKTIPGGMVQLEPARTARQSATEADAQGSTDVKLSSLSAQLQRLEQAHADTPVVNAERVAELKRAISEGHFKVNAEAVADRLIETVKDLIRAHKA